MAGLAQPVPVRWFDRDRHRVNGSLAQGSDRPSLQQHDGLTGKCPLHVLRAPLVLLHLSGQRRDCPCDCGVDRLLAAPAADRRVAAHDPLVGRGGTGHQPFAGAQDRLHHDGVRVTRYRIGGERHPCCPGSDHRLNEDRQPGPRACQLWVVRPDDVTERGRPASPHRRHELVLAVDVEDRRVKAGVGRGRQVFRRTRRPHCQRGVTPASNCLAHGCPDLDRNVDSRDSFCRSGRGQPRLIERVVERIGEQHHAVRHGETGAHEHGQVRRLVTCLSRVECIS